MSEDMIQGIDTEEVAEIESVSAADKKATKKAKPAKEVEAKPQYKVRKKLDPNLLVTVRNGFPGELFYVSRKTGEETKWEEFGSEQELEYSELVTAKNTYKRFFINNWFMIDDPEVLEALGVTKYYPFATSPEEFDELFYKSPDELTQIISGMSSGQKKTVAYRAKQLIESGELDSIKTINAMEAALSIQLIER